MEEWQKLKEKEKLRGGEKYMGKTRTIQTFLNLGDDTFVSAEKVKTADKTTKQKVISYLENMIKKHEEEIALWERTIAFIQS